MRRPAAIIGSAIFFAVPPGTLGGYLPWVMSRWRVGPPFLGVTAFRFVGALLIASGAAVVLESFARFVFKGLGTPAPIAPPVHLVVTGLYRFVRNPMYVGVVSAILGQGLLFGNLQVLEYGLLVAIGFHLFVLVYEEPTLRSSFGAEYDAFCDAVPRWIPRLRPWQGV